MIADALASLFATVPRTLDPINPRDPAVVKLLGLGRDASSGVRVDGDTVLGYPAVFRGVNIISNGVMKVRPLIYRRTPEGKERATEHQSWRAVTRQANSVLSAAAVRKTATVHALLHGNGLVWVDRFQSGAVMDMTPLVPGKCGMAVMRNGVLVADAREIQPDDEVMYWANVGGRIRPLFPDDVIHIKGLSITGYWGVSVVDVLMESFGLGMAARDFGARFFGQGATPTGIVTMPPGLKEAQQDDFREAIQKGSTGLGKAHKIMVVEEGTNYHPMTIEPEKAQFLQTRQFEIREIANIIGVQPHKLGDDAKLSYNSLEQSNQEHLDDDLDPWLQVWEDELEAKCLTQREQEEDTHFIEFNRKALVRTNLQARTERDLFERQNGISTANDVLRRENQNPIGEVGDTYMVPANMMVLGRDGMPIMPAAPEPDPIDDNETQGQPSARAGFTELALHEVERLAKRATKTAQAKAKQGGRVYVELLDELPFWPCKPESIALILHDSLEFIRGELEKFTEPPYGANELESNVAEASDDIVSETLSRARAQLETL